MAAGKAISRTRRQAGTLRDMATPAELLEQTNNAISALLSALTNVNCQEYQMPDGRRVRRAEFGTTLDTLRRVRSELQKEVAAISTPRVTLGRLTRR